MNTRAPGLSPRRFQGVGMVRNLHFSPLQSLFFLMLKLSYRNQWEPFLVLSDILLTV